MVSEPRRLPVPVIICQLPILKDGDDSCLERSLVVAGTVTGDVLRACGERVNSFETGIPLELI